MQVKRIRLTGDRSDDRFVTGFLEKLSPEKPSKFRDCG